MTTTVKTKSLLTAVNAVGVAATRTTLPILASVQIECAGESVKLAGTNLEMFVTEQIEAEGTGKFTAVVSYSLLSRFLARANASQTVLTMNGEILEVIVGDMQANFESLPAEEFPPNLRLEKPSDYEWPAEELLKPLQMVKHAVSNDIERYALQGVCIRSKEHGTDFVATNGRMMALYRSKNKTADIDAIVPTDAVNAILRNIAGTTIAITFASGAIAVRAGTSEIRAKLIEAKFPQYEDVIPTPGDKVFSADRKDLIEALTSAAIFLDRKTIDLGIVGRGKYFEVFCGKKSKIKVLGAETGGQPKLEIHYNWDYLRSTLQAIPGDVARLECRDEGSAIVIRDGAFFGIIMPLYHGTATASAAKK